MAACWAPDGVEHIQGFFDGVGPEAVRGFFADMFAAMPDFELSVQQQVAEGNKVAVHWHATGTFSGAPFQGLEPTGSRVRLEGLDLLRVENGLIVRNDAYSDGMSFAREIGVMPPQGSKQEQRFNVAINARTRAARRIAGDLETVADGVWLLRGGFPEKQMNVYFVRELDGSGVLMFDAGIRAMTGAVGAAAASLGGLTRIVLGHAHADHRGTAPFLHVPVFCHEADRADAESDGGDHYFHMERLGRPMRWILPRMLTWWDGGPVEIAGTLAEGDEVAGFRVVHLPGHAPGQIGLFRESDRLALSTDCFYTLNPETSMKGPPRLPHDAFNLDTEQARASLRKLAALEPSAAWPGHVEPVTGNVREQLERAAG